MMLMKSASSANALASAVPLAAFQPLAMMSRSRVTSVAGCGHHHHPVVP